MHFVCWTEWVMCIQVQIIYTRWPACVCLLVFADFANPSPAFLLPSLCSKHKLFLNPLILSNLSVPLTFSSLLSFILSVAVFPFFSYQVSPHPPSLSPLLFPSQPVLPVGCEPPGPPFPFLNSHQLYCHCLFHSVFLSVETLHCGTLVKQITSPVGFHVRVDHRRNLESF